MTEGRILLCAFSFCARAVFLFEKLTSVRTFILLGGLLLLISPDLKFAMFSSNVTLEEFALRSLSYSFFYKIFLNARWVAPVVVGVLKCFIRFAVDERVED